MVLRRRPSTPSAYREEFIDRVRSSRVMSGKEPADVARALRVKLDTYLRWEKRVLLPHHLIIPFCEIVEADPYMILTGVPFSLGKRQPQLEPELLKQA
jgi:hypothetical protein